MRDSKRWNKKDMEITPEEAQQELERGFWERTDKRKENECWPWTGSRTPQGYGHWRDMGAHRLSFTLFLGQIPPGLLVCHRCNNPICVNPKHLYLGTHEDNASDLKIKREEHIKNILGTLICPYCTKRINLMQATPKVV